MAITAIILDFDGLMVDTETPALRSWQLIYAEYGLELTLEQWSSALGSSEGFDPLANLLDRVGLGRLGVSPPELLARRQALKAELSSGEGLLPGVLELLGAADDLGLPLAVASSSSRAWVEGWLARLGLRERFAVVRTADDVARTKPDPALFLAAAAGVGRRPPECLVFEDSPNGILAARAAGCPVVAVPGAVSAGLALPPADLTLERLDAMALEAIIGRVAQ